MRPCNQMYTKRSVWHFIHHFQVSLPAVYEKYTKIKQNVIPRIEICLDNTNQSSEVEVRVNPNFSVLS